MEQSITGSIRISEINIKNKWKDWLNLIVNKVCLVGK